MAKAWAGNPSVPKIEAGNWPWKAMLCTVITVLAGFWPPANFT